MFEKATKQLVRQVDPNGALIAARLNDSKNIQVLGVVLKKQNVWPWKPPTYRPTCFTLNHLLEGEEIQPVRVEKEFLKYKETCRTAINGSMRVGNVAVGQDLNAHGKSKLHLSLGTLRKEDMDIPKLLKDSKGRKVDITQSFIQQSLKSKWIFTLVKQRIFTACECSISYTGQEQASCLSVFGGHSKMMFLRGSGDAQYDFDIDIDIPTDTVMAYSVIQINIRSDGYFDWFVEPVGMTFSAKFHCLKLDGPLALQEIKKGSSLCSLKKALLDVQTTFSALTDLSSECRFSLLFHLRKILLDRPVLSVLVDRLDSSDENPFLLNNKLSDSQSCLISEVLDLLKCEPFNKSGTSVASVANQNGSQAMHMLLSAVEELTDDGLKVLESLYSNEGLRSLRDLVNLLMDNSMPLSEDAIPVFIQKDDKFHRVVDLFKTCNVLLRKEDNFLFADVTCEEGFLPLVLCIVISGLACLSAKDRTKMLKKC